MDPFEALSLRVRDEKLEVLDQRLLPSQEVWLECHTPDDMVTCIRQLSIRGAPMIGVGAALALTQYAERGATPKEFVQAAEKLRLSRPTAVNLMHAIDRMLDSKNYSEESTKLIREERKSCQEMACLGASLIQEGEGILTHCNTGGLATPGIGTAIGVIRKAFEGGKNIHVYVDETRPLLQGGRLTAWELERLKIPYTLICDNMAASLMREGKIHRVFVGADRIAANGDFANKIGTYSVAVLARYHKIPFYPVAPVSTLDLRCEKGGDIPIEQRPAEEVRGYAKWQWSPSEASVYNPSFDVTPSELIEALILDTGIFTREELKRGVLQCGQ